MCKIFKTDEGKTYIRGKLISLFWCCGIILMIWGLITSLNSDGFDRGMSVIAIGVAVLAIHFSLKTDELVKSLADLNFDEKIAAIIGYVKIIDFKNNNNFSKDILHRLNWDFKAVSRLQKYASNEQKNELIKIIDSFIEHSKLNEQYLTDDEIRKDVEDIKKSRNKVHDKFFQ